jgi:hypothetical protein
MRRVLVVVIAVVAALMPAVSAAQQTGRDAFSGFVDELGGLQVGGLNSVNIGEPSYRVAKVLALNRLAVHVRVYANRFDARPTEVDPAVLDVGGRRHPLGIGIGHVPLTWDLFASWQPQLIRAGEVTQDELEGFREWERARGGVFDGPGGRRAILEILTVGP